MNDPRLKLESTGNAAFDEALGGGIPAQSVVVVAGEPGSGKTIFTLQTILHAARQGRKCLYFTTLSEPPIKLLRYMQQFAFFDADVFAKNVELVDLGAAVRHGAEKTMTEIETRVENSEPAIVVIDSFRAAADLLRGNEGARSFIHDLAVRMASWGATTLLVGEYRRADVATLPEFAVADGILMLGSEREGLTSVRALEILKMRGAAYISGQHFIEITRAGVSFYARVRMPILAETGGKANIRERVSTGVTGVDEMLGGGVPRSSSTVVQGGTGCGKTLLSLHFLAAGARNGEKGAYFTLEETPEQLRGIADEVGIDLSGLESKGLLRIRHASPVELSTDRFLNDLRAEVAALGATRVVLDSLTTMALGVPSERRFKEVVYAVAKHMRVAGVTLFLTAETEQRLGATTLSGDGVSFIADNLIQLRYVELDGALERAVSVLKARGIKHDSGLRCLRIDDKGLHVVKERFQDMRGVLTGLPQREGRPSS